MGGLITPENGQVAIFNATVIPLLVFTLIAVPLRLLSRKIAHTAFWWDDGLIIIGEVSSTPALFTVTVVELTALQLVLAGGFVSQTYGKLACKMNQRTLKIIVVKAGAGQHLGAIGLDKLELFLKARLAVTPFHQLQPC